MKIHRFYNHNTKGIDIIDKGQMQQIKSVLRLKVGDSITVFANNVEQRCNIKDISKDKVVLEAISKTEVVKPYKYIHV